MKMAIKVSDAKQSVKEVEGFDIEIYEGKKPANGNKKIIANLIRNQSSADWTVQDWINKRFDQNIVTGLKVAVLRRNGSKVQNDYYLRDVRSGYPASFRTDAKKLTSLEAEKRQKDEDEQSRLAELAEEKEKNTQLKKHARELENRSKERAAQEAREQAHEVLKAAYISIENIREGIKLRLEKIVNAEVIPPEISGV